MRIVFVNERLEKKASPRRGDDDVREIKSGGGRIALLGIPFFVSGLFLLYVTLGFVPMTMDGGPLVLAMLMPLGFLFTATGILLILSRHGMKIDRTSGTVVKWWGLLMPLIRRAYRLSDYDGLSLRFVKGVRGQEGIFCLSLVSSSPGVPLVDIITLSDYTGARKVGEDLSRFIEKPLSDTQGEENGREESSEAFDEPPREKTILQVPEPFLLRRPEGMKTKITESGGGLVLEFPPRRPGFRMWVAPSASFLLGALTSWFFAHALPPSVDGPLRYGTIGAIFLVFAVLPFWLSLKRRLRTENQIGRVTVNGDKLTFTDMAEGETSAMTIPFEDLEAFLHPPFSDAVRRSMETEPDQKTTAVASGSGRSDRVSLFSRFVRCAVNAWRPPALVARGAGVSVSFAAGLGDEELAYIYALIVRKLGH